MLLRELFTKRVDLKVKTDSSNKFITQAIIGKRKIMFWASKDDNRWHVVFGEHESTNLDADDEMDPEWSADMTGSGNEFEVMTMVKQSLSMLIEKHSPSIIAFTADKHEQSRVRVYERMLKRLCPSEYSFTRLDDRIEDAVYFSMSRRPDES